jgi:hypothetical protein
METLPTSPEKHLAFFLRLKNVNTNKVAIRLTKTNLGNRTILLSEI